MKPIKFSHLFVLRINTSIVTIKKINNKASLTVKVKDALILLEYSFHFDR